jgi:hypothetical protein
MVGGLAFLIGGNMAVAGSGQGGALIRVDPARSARLIATTAAEPILIGGLPMWSGWVHLDAEHVRTERQLENRIEIGVPMISAPIPRPCCWAKASSMARLPPGCHPRMANIHWCSLSPA